MQSSPIRVAIIGCGGISAVHIAALQALPGVSITAVCDVREDRARAAAQKTGARPVFDARELAMASDVDAVHICAPHDVHADAGIELLNAGKWVLTEKPLSICVDRARALLAAADASTGRLGVIFQNRYNPCVRRARALMASGEMGAFLGARASVTWHREAPYYTQSGWRGTKVREGAGCLINQSIHTLDLLSYIGGAIDRVRAEVFTGLLEGVIEVEDNACATMTYLSGQSAVFHATNNYACDAPVEIEFQMEKGSLRLVGPKLYRIVGDEWTLLEAGEPASLSEKAYWGSGHAAEIKDFYEAFRKNEPFWLDGRQGFASIALVDAILSSSRSHSWVNVERV